MKSKTRKVFDWSKYDDVCFAVLGYSSSLGWLELWRGRGDAGEAWRKYDAQDYRNKLLLNFGAIVRQEGEVVP